MGRETDNGGGFDRPRLVAAAQRRHWVVSIAELHARGFTDRQIAYAVRTGFLHRKHRGVFAVGRPELSFEGECLAATLACGPGSAVSHGPAGRLWGFRKWWGAIHVSGPRSLEGRPGLIVHRPRRLAPEDLTTRNGIVVTSVARTLLDMSPGTPVNTIAGWIHEAGVQGVFDKRAVWETLQRNLHHRGRKNLLAGLAHEFAPTRSGLEDVFLALSRRARMPAVLVNEELWSGEKLEEVDFYYPTLGLIVEVDGGRYHASRWRQRRDKAKNERFEARNFKVWRIPEIEITFDPAGVVAKLAHLAATLGPPNPPLVSI